MRIMKKQQLLFLILFAILSSNKVKPVFAADLGCGNFISATEKDNNTCSCSSGWQDFSYYGRANSCCGWVLDYEGTTKCFATSDPDINPPLEITEGVSNQTFDTLNPLKIAESPVADNLSTPGGIVTRLLNFLFPLAGLILFALISWGGFEMLISAGDQKGLEAGKNRVTAAIVGFLLLFSAYWLAQIVEMVFGITIL